jgi:cytochrome P450
MLTSTGHLTPHKAFTPRAVDARRPVMRAVTHELIDSFAAPCAAGGGVASSVWTSVRSRVYASMLCARLPL